MKFSKVVTWFLACVVLLLGAVSASAATTVKGSKSNGSEKVLVCRDFACCKASPSAKFSNGQPCSAILNIEKRRFQTLSNSSREAALMPVPTPKTEKVVKGAIQGLDKKEAAPTPSDRKGRGLGIAAHKEGQPTTPTANPRDIGSGLPTGREVVPVSATSVPTPKSKNGLMPCPMGEVAGENCRPATDAPTTSIAPTVQGSNRPNRPGCWVCSDPPRCHAVTWYQPCPAESRMIQMPAGKK